MLLYVRCTGQSRGKGQHRSPSRKQNCFSQAILMIPQIAAFGNTCKTILAEKPFTWQNALRFSSMLLKQKPKAGPLKLVLDITSRCDMDCSMCFYHSRMLPPCPPEELPIGDIVRLFKECRMLGVKKILLCGQGEPLLHPDFKEVVAQADTHMLETELMTNAYYLTPEIIRHLLSHKLKKIIISLHCADEKTFLKVHPHREARDFQLIIKNIQCLNRLRPASLAPSLYLLSVVSSCNHDSSAALGKLAVKLKAQKILFKPLTLPDGLKGKGLELDAEKKQRIFQDLLALKRNIPIAHNITDYLKTLLREQTTAPDNNHCSKDQKTRSRCYIPWFQSVISAKGEVNACAYAAHSMIGSIKNASLCDIWSAESYQSFRSGKYCPADCRARAVYPLLP